MKIKTKVALAVGSLFVVMLVIGIMSMYYLNELSGDSRNILKDNYETLQYTRQIIDYLDSFSRDSTGAFNNIERVLQQQEQNMTEPGERELTLALRQSFEKLRSGPATAARITEIRKYCLAIEDLNMRAIIRKNEITQATSKRASTYLIFTITITALCAFSLMVNFPGYIANPIVRLTESIKSIANRNYEERLTFDRRDEFEELAMAFNLMAEKLDEYEHSNVAKILFEKRRIETIINRMSDPVIGLDQNNKVVFANDQALLLMNLTLDRVIDRYAPDVAVENDLFRNLIKPDNPKEPGNGALVKAVVNGKENYFSKESIDINYTPTGETQTQVIGRVIILRNITSYKELDLAKTNFIATISHELKTPIASLQMCTKLLHDQRIGAMNPEQQNIIQTLTYETNRLARITNELLDLTQVETGNIKLNMQQASVEDVIQVALEAVKFQAERKHVKVQVHLPAKIPTLYADLDKTAWVLVNLLNNAIRYSAENGAVELSCSQPNNHVAFEVRDFGPGIEEKYRKRLFEKFFQVPGTPSGTGLGLAISKEFIEAQGGTIRAESEPGKGSTFLFELRAS